MSVRPIRSREHDDIRVLRTTGAKKVWGMISNQVLQNTIDGLKEISHLDICIMDADGVQVVSTAEVFGEAAAAVADFTGSPAQTQAAGPFQFFKVSDDNHLEYIVVICGDDDNSLMVGRMAAFQLQGLLAAFKEHYDRDGFMKNLLLDNLLLIDIYERAKKLRIPSNVPRVVMLVENDRTQHRERDALATMQDFMGTSQTDFVTAVDENYVVVVKDLSGSTRGNEMEKLSASVMKHMTSLGFTGIRISYGNAVAELRDISRSYKEAKMALDVSRIFFEDKDIIAYSQLGIGRLIYQLPIPLCKMFIREIFKDRKPDDFDEETLVTINKFFENNLNVSETSRQLFIHRNTLVYRLDKLMRSTGLDLRIFEDAITFKIALMVVKYMQYMEEE